MTDFFHNIRCATRLLRERLQMVDLLSIERRCQAHEVPVMRLHGMHGQRRVGSWAILDR